MIKKTQKEIKEFKNTDASGQISEPVAEKTHLLSDDPDFKKLREYYQAAELNRCYRLLYNLEKRFPGHPILGKYHEEIEIRQTMKSMENEGKKLEKRRRKKKRVQLGLFAAGSTLLVIFVFVYSYFYINIKVSAKQLEEESALLSELDEQIEQLLLIGKPRDAAGVLEQIRNIDPAYERFDNLELKIYQLLVLDEKYQNALLLLETDEKDAALNIFTEIENEWPGLWDVRQRITILENTLNN